jgi:hypothetical protein
MNRVKHVATFSSQISILNSKIKTTKTQLVAVENETKKGIEYFYSIILLPLKM